MATTPARSQTLSRGIRMLEVVVAAPTAPSIDEVACELGVHRSIAYRILRTLEDHSLLLRDEAGRIHGAPGLAVLARGVAQDLQSVALPELTRLANELGMSAFVAVWSNGECVTLVTVEPSSSNVVTQRPGTRHPIDRGAPAWALQAGLDDDELRELVPGHRPCAELETARALGYAASHDQVIRGVASVAVPLRVQGHPPASLAIVYATREIDVEAVGRRLAAAARQIAGRMGARGQEDEMSGGTS